MLRNLIGAHLEWFENFFDNSWKWFERNMFLIASLMMSICPMFSLYILVSGNYKPGRFREMIGSLVVGVILSLIMWIFHILAMIEDLIDEKLEREDKNKLPPLQRGD